MFKGENMFVDTHAHLTDGQFKDDIESVIEKAKQCTIEKIVTSGYDLESSFDSVNLANKYNEIYASVGVFPEYADKFDEKIEKELFNLAKNKKVVAIGEIGLQYTEGMPDRKIQKETFLRQLKIAYSLQKPVVIHCRDAYGDAIELLKANKHLLTFSGTFHCYGGSYETAKEIIKLGLFISVGGVSTFKNAENVREMLKKVPIENIILETDCPYLAPVPYRGKRNDPSFIPTIAQNLAELKGLKIEEVGNITTQNARRLFKI